MRSVRSGKSQYPSSTWRAAGSGEKNRSLATGSVQRPAEARWWKEEDSRKTPHRNRFFDTRQHRLRQEQPVFPRKGPALSLVPFPVQISRIIHKAFCCSSKLTTATTLQCAKAHAKKVLNVPTGTPPVLFHRAPCICSHFLRLAKKVHELFGMKNVRKIALPRLAAAAETICVYLFDLA